MQANSLFTHDDPAFDPETTAAMATALDQVCEALNINGNATAREVIAVRIVELARRGVRDPTSFVTAYSRRRTAGRAVSRDRAKVGSDH